MKPWSGKRGDFKRKSGSAFYRDKLRRMNNRDNNKSAQILNAFNSQSVSQARKMATKNNDYYSEEDFDAILAALEEEDEAFEKELCTVVEDVSYNSIAQSLSK